MNENQAERLAEIVKELNAYADDGNNRNAKDFEGLKLIDLFAAITTGAIAKMNVITELFKTASNLPYDTPENVIKHEALRLESVVRQQINGLCDCLLVLTACENPTQKKKEAK